MLGLLCNLVKIFQYIAREVSGSGSDLTAVFGELYTSMISVIQPVFGYFLK